MACDPWAIRTALADQIRSYVATDINVYWHGMRNPDNPSIQVKAAAEHIAYIGTFGADGVGDMMLELVVQFNATDDESEVRRLCELQSAGTDMPSSLFDAVHSDRTLGGVVSDAVLLTADQVVEGDPEVPTSMVVPVRIVFTKSGAKV